MTFEYTFTSIVPDFLLSSSYDSTQLTDEEKEQLDKLRTEKSLFVQDLLLSSLAHSDTSSESSDET